ncbi:SpoIIE family protein phosphatase [Streptomyces sp. NPDC058964]|uniref:SpoIIE family protein phosphatase n=1 Tax=Streptomyces sp. NPDC058964 TaxID=3346681 RepID=UPI00369AA453
MPDDDVLLLLDQDGTVTGWGRSAEEIFGWSAADAVGQSVTALLRKARIVDGQSLGTAALLVRPTLQDRSVVWQVLATGDDAAPLRATALEALFAHSPLDLKIFDDQLRLVRTSSPAGKRPGVAASAAGPLGTPFTEACGCVAPEQEARVARSVLEGAEPVLNRVVPSTEVSARYGRHLRSVSYLRLEDSGGTALGLLACAADVTARERAQQCLGALKTVRTHMGHRLSLMDACQEFVEAVVPDFAATAVVEVVESAVRCEDALMAPVGPGVLLRQAAVHGRVPASKAGAVRPLPSGTPFSQVLSDLRPRLVPVSRDSAWLAADPVLAGIVKESEAHSLIVAPLALDDRVLGMVTFCRHGHDDAFAEDDLAVASAMCAHAALCVDRAYLYMREWIIMSTVQRRLLPGQLTDQPTMQISSLHIPGAKGGGAWSDAIALPGSRTALVVGDVAGQGIPAAITMGLLRTAIHTLAALDLQPDELLARLSDTTAQLVAARAALPPMDPLIHEPLTAGCTIAVYDPVDLTCTIARAGLPEPLAIFPDGTSSVRPVPPGPALAATDTAPFPATTIPLPEGSTLAMGTAQLADEVLSSSGTLRPLLDDACAVPVTSLRDTVEHAYTQREPVNETLLLLARTKALPPERVMTCALPEGPEAAPIARRAARGQMEAWGMDEETAYTNELIVSELVGNATRYGAPPLRLRLIRGRMLTCEVTDAAPSAPHVKHARTIDESGRGLFIIASLAEQWGTRYTTEGKIVWAEQPTGTNTSSA